MKFNEQKLLKQNLKVQQQQYQTLELNKILPEPFLSTSYVPKIHLEVIFNLIICLPNICYPGGFPTKILHVFFVPPCPATIVA